GPAGPCVFGKPIVGDLVVNVIGIEQRQQQIDVKQRDDDEPRSAQRHASSRNSLTSFIVGRGAPGGRRGSSGTPFLNRIVFGGARALRASSEITFPAVVFRAAASSFAACRMSASRSSVVLTHRIITHQTSDVNARQETLQGALN